MQAPSKNLYADLAWAPDADAGHSDEAYQQAIRLE